MAKYRCTVCNYVYDEEVEGVKFDELPENWRCPVCNSPKSAFVFLCEGETCKEPEKAEGEKKTVSEIMIAQMVEWGVKYVFGLPGTSSLGVVDAIRKNDSIQYVQVRHEQAAALMASAYGKLTGHVAACLTIAGPGATNLATGLYDAKLDHSPVLALTGMVKRQLIGPGSFQEIDQHAFFDPVTVFNKTLMSEDQTTSLTTLAIKHALLDRGVSHIGIPNDVQKKPCKGRVISFKDRMPNQAILQPEILVKKAAKLINDAKRPVVVAGFGAMGHGAKLLELAEKIDAPVTTTFRGKGVMDEYNQLYVGSHGTIGSTVSAELVQKADLLIVVGSSFSDMTQIPEKKTVQIDIDPLMIARRYPVEAPLLGNSSELLPRILESVERKQRPDYLKEIAALKRSWLDLLEEEADSSSSPLRPQYIIKVLNEKLADDAIISLDVGENGWWFGRNFLMRETQKLLMSGYLATMGFGLPAAITAQLVYPEKQVACISGDGGFSMVMGEFMTACKYDLPINLFLMDNRQLGMIMQEQKVENYPNWQTDLHNCDFAEYAESCGGVGIKVENPEELPEAVDNALNLDKPVLVNIDTDPRRFI